jgi:hypothetical protein
VGFATEEELNNAFTGTLDFDNDAEKMKEQCDMVARTFARYKEIQLSTGDDYHDFKAAKEELNKRLKELNHELNLLLHKQSGGLKYDDWLASHQPFHWFAEFYEIIHDRGGFDVVIGNPPYVVYNRRDKKTKKSVEDLYKIENYSTRPTNNLYSFVIERSFDIISSNCIGMIIPLTSISNNNMLELRSLIFSKGVQYYSSYEIRPSKLFEGVDQRLTIFLIRPAESKVNTTKVLRWGSEQREHLFSSISYSDSFYKDTIWRLSSTLENNIYSKFSLHKTINQYLSLTIQLDNQIHYRTAGARYWVIFTNNGFDSVSLSNKSASIKSEFCSKYFMALLNSNLFWWYYAVNFDMFNIKDYMIFSFRNSYKESCQKLIELSNKLQNDLDKNKVELITNSRTRGTIESYVYKKKESKSIVDEIDTILAEHYNFTEEELDFIINYDIKYRMGKELGNGEEDEMGDSEE